MRIICGPYVGFMQKLFSSTLDSFAQGSSNIACLIKKAALNSLVGRCAHHLWYYSCVQPPDGKLELITLPDFRF